MVNNFCNNFKFSDSCEFVFLERICKNDDNLMVKRAEQGKATLGFTKLVKCFLPLRSLNFCTDNSKNIPKILFTCLPTSQKSESITENEINVVISQVDIIDDECCECKAMSFKKYI